MAKINFLFLSDYVKILKFKILRVIQKSMALLALFILTLAGFPAFSSSGKGTDGEGNGKLLNNNNEITGSAFDLQQRKISGTITDENGNPLPGVNIMIEGTTLGSISDVAGKYTIDIPNEKAVLVFTFVGYGTQKVTAAGQNSVSIKMVPDVMNLDEVVVVGYGTQRKKDITGAIAVVSTESLKAIPTGDAVMALQGLASGVTVIGSGVPGGRTDIFIRGVTSLGNTSPLVIVDGVPGSLTNLNVNDIESIQVLKDAGASSIYGVRGSNGVIVVTTNKGKPGDPKITLDSYYGYTVPKQGNVFNLLNSEDYARITKLANPNTILFANGLPDYLFASIAGNGTAMEGDPRVDPAKYNFDFNNYKNNYLIQKVNKVGTDWFHEVSRTAPTQSHNLSVSGGSNKSNYLFSMGYLDQQGTIMETYLKRYSVRVNTQSTIRKNIRIGENVYAYYRLSPGFSNSAEGNPISNCFRLMPIIPVYDIKGNFGGTYIGPELGTTSQPVASQIRSRDNRSHGWNVSGNTFAEVDLLNKHLVARTSFGGSLYNNYNYSLSYIGYNDREGFDGYNSFSEGASYSRSITWTNTLNYSNTFGKHNVKLLVGSEAISGYGRNISGSSRNYFSMDPNYMNLSNGTAIISSTSGAYKNALYSLFSRLDYAYADRYILGVTVRRDGSSVFGSEKRYGVFPSFSLGWRIKNEFFLKDVTFIDDLKLRGSYGILGSQENIGSTNAYTLFNSGFATSYYLISGTGNTTTQGFYQSSNGNPYTGWEENVVTNVGIDVAFLKNKLTGSLEWYKKSINGLLFPQPLPATAGGASAPTINIGDIQNVGWDFNISYRESVSKDLQYGVTFSISTYKNDVVRIPGKYFDIKSSRIGNLVRIQEGHPVGTFYGYQIIGIFKDDAEVAASPTQTAAAPGRFKYLDVNGDKVINSDDRTFFGDPNPDFTYGLNFNVAYKGFDLAADFYGSQGNDNLNFVRYYTDFMSTSEGKGRSNVLLNAWTSSNTNTSVPKIDMAPNFSTNSVPNSYYLEDGSFFKCRSAILGYTFSPDLVKKLKIDKLRVYFQCTNPFTITKYTGLDPELSGTLSGTNASTSFGIDMGNYPNNQRRYLIGVKLSF
jgi:TonB-dependent starch-binding outer membrane protein SusC